jgi:hypothetical protein
MTAAQPLTAPLGSLGSFEELSSGGIPQMIGDLGPPPFARYLQPSQFPGVPPPFPPPRPPGVPRPGGASLVVPTLRGIKVSENQSPRPQDRVYFTFNYFQGVNDQLNRELHAPIGYTQVFRYIFGFEKTYCEGQGSIGLRFPLDHVDAKSNIPPAFGNGGGSSTAVGDLSLYTKYILWEDRPSGSLISSGLALGLPTGPGRFAGLDSFAGITHATTFQPFLGYIFASGRFYVHGFSAIDVPTTSQDVTYIYNDIGIGYFLRRPDPDTRVDEMISVIAPTFEVHINDPLNHRDTSNPRDPVAMKDIVNLTYGLNVGVYRRTLFTFGVVTPVTGPRPFDFEVTAFANFFFGGNRRTQAATPPVVGGY